MERLCHIGYSVIFSAFFVIECSLADDYGLDDYRIQETRELMEKLRSENPHIGGSRPNINFSDGGAFAEEGRRLIDNTRRFNNNLEEEKGYIYREVIDPITDKDDSYVMSNENFGIINSKAWIVRISCDGEDPEISFEIPFRSRNDFYSSWNTIDRKNKIEEGESAARDFLSGESFLKVIYRVDRADPVGYEKWDAWVSGSNVKFDVPESGASSFLKSIEESDKYVVRVKTKQNTEKTYTFDSGGLKAATGKLSCVD